MSVEDCNNLLSNCYARAMRDAAYASPSDRSGIRRAFRRALRAAQGGDARPTVLLAYRYP